MCVCFLFDISKIRTLLIKVFSPIRAAERSSDCVCHGTTFTDQEAVVLPTVGDVYALFSLPVYMETRRVSEKRYVEEK